MKEKVLKNILEHKERVKEKSQFNFFKCKEKEKWTK